MKAEHGIPVGSDKAVVDRQVQEAAQRALNGTGHQLLNRVNVQVIDGHVRLTGHVPSFYLKSVATSVVLNIDGVIALTNNLHVHRAKRQ